jgi:branched-chain amino acid transport system substrate-binding protein
VTLTPRTFLHLFGSALLLVATAAPVRAEITIGVIVSATGAAASQGIPERNLISLLPPKLAGESVKYVILDDATDPTQAVRNARKLTAEDHVDAFLAASTTPTAQAIAQVALESQTPHVSMAPLAPTPAQQPWVFIVPQSANLMIEAVLEHMQAHGVKTVGYIGYSNSWGDLVYQSLTTMADKHGITVLNNERYERTDTAVTGQVLKSVALKPDAMLIGATGTPAALPQLTLLERGYKGPIYHTHGVVNDDFLRVGAKGAEGALAPIGPVVAWKDLPDGNPVKQVSADFVALYAKGNAASASGPVNAFATWAYDGYLLLERASTEALKKAAPGTPEFRSALRNALENNTAGVVGTNGIYNIGPKDHNGLDKRARVMVRVVNADWRLAP